MAGRALKFDRRETTFRLAAVFWGFAFIHTLRWLLDAFFPYYRSYFTLSQFALVLFIVAFAAAALYGHVRSRWRSFLFRDATHKLSWRRVFTFVFTARGRNRIPAVTRTSEPFGSGNLV